MDWFSEKFMEDCIAEAPEAFLGRPLKLAQQQPRLGGFVPDLVFVDHLGDPLIVEVQRAALDRYHLYKCLEYRDLFAGSKGGKAPSIILVCETFAPRYEAIAATHNIEVFVIDQKTFTNKAVGNCPQSLANHLVKQSSQVTLAVSKPDTLRQYAWNQYDDLTDIYGFVCRELARCGLWEKYQRSAGSGILWQARSVLDTRDLCRRVVDPTGWCIDNLIEEPKGWVPPHLEKLTRIRKPRAVLDVFVTSKDNLSVRWFPKGANWWERSDKHDWVEAPSTEPYAYQRPENELLFVKDIYDLSTDADQYMHLPDGDEKATINSMMLALIWGMIRHIQNILSATVELEVLREFQLLKGNPIGANSLASARYEITGWRIINAKDIRVEKANERISLFNSQNKLSVETVLSTLAAELRKPVPPKGDRPTYLAKALRANGHKITAVPIRQLLSDFEEADHPDYRPFKASGA